jgi:hypothetical protein
MLENLLQAYRVPAANNIQFVQQDQQCVAKENAKDVPEIQVLLLSAAEQYKYVQAEAHRVILVANSRKDVHIQVVQICNAVVGQAPWEYVA